MNYYSRNRKMDTKLYKGLLYDRTKEKAQEFYLDNDQELITECIEDAIDYYWDDFLMSEDYSDIEDTDKLDALLTKELKYDLRDIVDDCTIDNNYWGLSIEQRNY